MVSFIIKIMQMGIELKQDYDYVTCGCELTRSSGKCQVFKRNL